MEPMNSKRIEQLSVADIVGNDYRTADVFHKYGIDFCCGSRVPLETVCESRQLDVLIVRKELEDSRRTICLPPTLDFDKWDVDFLTEYIIHVHHEYLKNALPLAQVYLARFVDAHQKKIPSLARLSGSVNDLITEMLPHLLHEEQIIFPYIRQLTHAYHNKESYAGLLVRTLRKPVESVMHHEDATVSKILHEMRNLTDHYTLPERACVNHKVAFMKLREIDNDLVQHMFLENNILFPKAISMEKELLARQESYR